MAAFDAFGITYAELIPSKDVREYLEEKGVVFTDFEKATLIYNHSEMNFIEKAAYLKGLMEQTENETLKEEIQDRLSYDKLCLSRFYENNGDYIYELEAYDPEDKTFYEMGYFKSGKVAVGCGKKFQENYSIHKIQLLTEEKDPEECDADYTAAVYFDHQGLHDTQGSYAFIFCIMLLICLLRSRKLDSGGGQILKLAKKFRLILSVHQ